MNEKCKWGMYSRFDDGVWGTSCGAEWEFTYGGTPDEHGMKYCPYCGKEVEEIPNEHDLSVFERLIIEHIPDKFMYMARDADGELCVYSAAPAKGDCKNTLSTQWLLISEVDEMRTDTFESIFFENVFKNVKWEDDEPWNFREEAE